MIILFFGIRDENIKNYADKVYEEIWETSWAGAIRIDEKDWYNVTKNYNIYAFQTAVYLESRDYIPILSFTCSEDKIRLYLIESAKNLIQIHLHSKEDSDVEQLSSNSYDKTKCLSIDTSLDFRENVDTIIEYIFENSKMNLEDEI